MKEKEFYKLVEKDKYQVFLFVSRIPVPFHFALHAWFVTNEKGKLNRWEVWQLKNRCKTSWGYLHLNLYKPLIGVRMFVNNKPNPNVLRFKARLFGIIEGKKGSIAEKMIKSIKKSKNNYIYLNKYRTYPGPNSNSYMQWILSKFPKSGLKLPWNAFGKSYSAS